MLSLWEVAAGVLLPGAVTAALLLASWRATRRRMSARDSRSWAGPAVLAVGFGAGYAALFGWPELPPPDVVDWLFWLAWPLAALGLLVTLWPMGVLGRAAWLAGIVPGSCVRLAWPVLSQQGALGWGFVLGASAFAVVMLVASGALSARMSAMRLSGTLALAAACGSAALVLSGSLRLGQIGIVLTAAELGSLAALLFLGHAARGRGVMLVFGPLWTGLLLCGVLYSSLSIPAATLLLAAPNAALLANQGHRRPARQVRRALVQLALVGAVGLLAVAIAWLGSARN